MGRLLERAPWEGSSRGLLGKAPREGSLERLLEKAPWKGSSRGLLGKAPREGSLGRFLEKAPWEGSLEGSQWKSREGNPGRSWERESEPKNLKKPVVFTCFFCETCCFPAGFSIFFFWKMLFFSLVFQCFWKGSNLDGGGGALITSELSSPEGFVRE